MKSSSSTRYLTKSRFKEALDCPTKLFYTKKEEYANKKNTDTFLQSLAEGGFQVEELARMSYPEGVAILGDDSEYDKVVSRTAVLLQRENITIFEAAFLYDGLFIRVDILNKKGNDVQLIEVKAKSISKINHHGFVKKKKLDAGWTPYLYDVAFQKYVIQQCFPHWKIKAWLMLANKDAVSTVDGLNQFFRIKKDKKSRTGIIKPDHLSLEDLGDPILTKIRVDEEVDFIYNNNPVDETHSFFELITYYKDHYEKDHKIFTEIGKHCKTCQFVADADENKKSGFHECWTSQLQLSREKIDRPKVYDISNFRKAGKLMEEGKYFIDQLTENDVDPVPEAGKMSTTERQWIQIEKVQNDDKEPYFELEGLRDELKQWKFPLNFIDFETSAVALPFTKGRRPYEQVAFQYSHHIVHEDGRVEHASQHVNTRPGVFPNFDFIKALKKSLESNKGSIFRYHNHENTIVNAIHTQLLDSNETDKEELIEFIEEISHNTGNSISKWRGNRDMIDLWKVVKDYYYDPYTNGSNSIKAILPAVLNSSKFLQNKYQKPLSEINLTSKNFDPHHTFLKQLENGAFENPYKLLPPLFEGWNNEDLDNTVTDIEGISDGGAALTAYGKLQFEEISDKERKAIESGLLKYCELDTLAMVMIYEYFMEVVKTN